MSNVRNASSKKNAKTNILLSSVRSSIVMLKYVMTGIQKNASFKKKCTFLAKHVCAFSHETLAID